MQRIWCPSTSSGADIRPSSVGHPLRQRWILGLALWNCHPSSRLSQRAPNRPPQPIIDPRDHSDWWRLLGFDWHVVENWFTDVGRSTDPGCWADGLDKVGWLTVRVCLDAVGPGAEGSVLEVGSGVLKKTNEWLAICRVLSGSSPLKMARSCWEIHRPLRLTWRKYRRDDAYMYMYVWRL